jgi:hypothetical protein
LTRRVLLLALLAASSAAAQRPSSTAFREAAAAAGLDFRHFTGATGHFYLPEIMGAGVALFDYDNDGDLDAYLIQGTMLEPGKKPAESIFPPRPGQPPGNRLFRNELVPSGKLRFTDVTAAAGVGHVGYGMGVAVGDYDNDGDLDLYVTNFGSNVLYRNNGNGTFTDVTREAGVDDPRWSASTAFLDYDRDGRLDLFVANYLDYTLKGNKRCQAPTGEPDYCTPAAYRPAPARLFHNEGNGRFKDVTQSAGIGAAFGPGLGVVCADFDGDGWTDIYVANDGAANLLWMNQHDGTFKEEALLRGAAYSEDGVQRAGMGVTAEDFDNDGDEDILVTNLRREGSTLLRNNGSGIFTDVSAELGVGTATFLFTGFGVRFFDYDNDGRLDLFIANGSVTLLEALRGTRYPFGQRNLLFHNEGKFREVALAGPLEEVSRGVAIADLDNDGDLDIVVTNNNGPVRLLLDEAATGAHWLEVKLEGVQVNRQGIGARVAVVDGSAKPVWRRVHSDGSYCSAAPAVAHFGLGGAAAIDSVDVLWPGGARERWTGIRVDSRVALKQGTGKPVP